MNGSGVSVGWTWGYPEPSRAHHNEVACNRIHLENGVGSMEAVGLGHLNFESFHFEGGVGGAVAILGRRVVAHLLRGSGVERHHHRVRRRSSRRTPTTKCWPGIPTMASS